VKDTEILVDQARSGDADAVEQLLVRHLPSIDAYVRLRAGKLVRAKESTADVVQSVCREVLEHIEDFDFRGEAQFRHWLCQHALHKILNKKRFYTAEKRDAARELAARSRSSDARSNVLDCYASICTPSRVAAGKEAMEAFERAFGELPEDYRVVISLHRIVGLSFKEIGPMMNRTEGAARNLFNRGVARLSTMLVDRE
jgi:RNA polymerase sigma-70 factor (ECF subfamily)